MSNFREIEDEEFEVEMMCLEDEDDEENLVENEFELGGPTQPGRVVVRGAAAHDFEPLRRDRDVDEDDDIPEIPQNGDFYRGRRDDRDHMNWCSCQGCIVMPHFTDSECRCCREIPQTKAVADRDEVLCVTQIADFQPAILNQLTLFLAWSSFTEKYRQEARSFDNRGNEKYRYVAYRQFVRLCWGYLGKHVRVTTPACAHALIDNSYPDGANQYRGTILRRLEDHEDE